jgi:probable O-glycosylation ligase (exosortase A-associated)
MSLRDIFIIAFLPYLVYLVLRRPFIGAAMWIWSALLSPHQWVWGLAGSIRYNFLFAIASFASYVLYKHRAMIVWSWLATLVLVFYFWMSMSTLLAISETNIPFHEWDKFTRVVALVVFCQVVLTRKLHVDVFIWAIVLVLGGYGMLEGAKYLLSGFSHSVRGIGGSDRNHLALFLNMTIPLAIYLRSQTSSRYLRIGLLAMVAMLAVAVIGTFSRGGLIALAGLAGFYLLLSGRRFVPAALAVGLLAYGLSLVVTDEYMERAQTIQTADEDGSFMGRAMAWKMSIYIALDHPVFGGGPYAVQSPDVWQRYLPVYDTEQFFTTRPAREDYAAAHSIYFQVLGDTGFGGLFVFMTMLFGGLLVALRSSSAGKKTGNQGITELGRALFLSLATLMIGGSALSVAYYDHIYAILALISVVGARCRNPTFVSHSHEPAKESQIARGQPVHYPTWRHRPGMQNTSGRWDD